MKTPKIKEISSEVSSEFEDILSSEEEIKKKD